MSSDVSFNSATKHVWNSEPVTGGAFGKAFFTGTAMLADLGRLVGYYLQLHDGKLGSFWGEKKIEPVDSKYPNELDLPESLDPNFVVDLDPVEEDVVVDELSVEEAPPAPVELPKEVSPDLQLLESDVFKKQFSKIGKSDSSRKNYNQQVVDFAKWARSEIEQGPISNTVKLVSDIQQWVERLTQSYQQGDREIVGFDVIHFGASVRSANELLFFGDKEHCVKGIFSEIGRPEVSQQLTKELFEELENSLDIITFKERATILQQAGLVKEQDLAFKQLRGREKELLVNGLKQYIFEKFKDNHYPDAQMMYALFMKEGLNSRDVDIGAIAKEAQIAAVKGEMEQAGVRIEEIKEEIKEVRESLRFANRAQELKAIAEQDKQALQDHLDKVNKLDERVQRLESEVSNHTFNCKEAMKSTQQLKEMQKRVPLLESDVKKSENGFQLRQALEQLRQQLPTLEKKSKLSAKDLENFLKKSTLTAERIDAKIHECTDQIEKKRNEWKSLLIRIKQIEKALVEDREPNVEKSSSTLSKIFLVASGILGLTAATLGYDQFYNNGALTTYLYRS